jgi:hypothetical protein
MWVVPFIKKYCKQNRHGMANRKLSLILKAVLIVVFVIYVVAIPTKDIVRMGIRFAMLVFFTVTFIIELNKYRKDDA